MRFFGKGRFLLIEVAAWEITPTGRVREVKKLDFFDHFFEAFFGRAFGGDLGRILVRFGEDLGRIWGGLGDFGGFLRKKMLKI